MKSNICRTCAFWRVGASPSALTPVPDESASDIGVCEVMSPEVHIRPDGSVHAVQPPTHATRSCAMWEPGGGDDDPEHGGLPVPSNHEKIRTLFPVQPAPVAA